MSAVFTDEQRALRDAVSGLLTKRSDPAAVRRAIDSDAGYDTALWAALCDQIGVAALAVPERFGGLGAGPTETRVVLEELGAGLTPSPMLGSAVFAVQLLLAAADDAACERLLPRVAAGEVAAVAWAGAEGDPAGPFTVADGRLTGTARQVLDGDSASVLLVVAGGAVYEVDPGTATRARVPGLDLTRRLATVTLDGAVATRLGPADATAAIERALDAGAVALAVEQVGAAARLLDLTVDYTKVRRQFGRPIGGFQALKHRMADLHVLVETARSAAYAAAAGQLMPSLAAAHCGETFRTVAGEAIQLHGGIAITWEHDAHLYLRRAWGDAPLFGTPEHHVRRVGDALAAQP